MFGSDIKAIKSNFSSFGRFGNPQTLSNSTEFTAVQEAAIGIGFFGVDYIADKIKIPNPEGFFIESLAQIFPPDVQKEVQMAYDVFRFAEQMIIENGYAHLQLTHTQKPIGYVLYLLESFHESKWDVENTVSRMIADEFDPNPSVFKFFSIMTRPGTVTPAFKALITQLALDFPRLKFMLDMLLAKLQISESAAIGTRSDIQQSQLAYSVSIPGTASTIAASASISTMNAAKKSLANKPIYNATVNKAQGAQVATDTNPTGGAVQAPGSAFSFPNAALGAAIGLLLGGPAGAVAGAGAGLLGGGK